MGHRRVRTQRANNFKHDSGTHQLPKIQGCELQQNHCTAY